MSLKYEPASEPLHISVEGSYPGLATPAKSLAGEAFGGVLLALNVALVPFYFFFITLEPRVE